MKTLYVAGKYSAINERGVCRNIEAALLAAVQIAKLGVNPVVPHVSHVAALAQGDYMEAMRLCYELLAECDGLYLAPGWALSPGACNEKRQAETLGLPVFSDLDAVSAWVKDSAPPVREQIR